MLPSGDTKIFSESTFFKQSGAPSLPSPDQVRLMADKSDGHHRDPRRAQVTYFPDMHLVVKWGTNVFLDEAQCIWALSALLPNLVPVPELFGWCRDQQQFFIYMELVKGDTLENRWSELSVGEKTEICEQLQKITRSLRLLEQNAEDRFIGSISGHPLQDIIFIDSCSPPAGPFRTVQSFNDYYTHPRLLNSSPNPQAHPMRNMLPDDMRIIFTHSDLHRSNIIIRTEGPPCIAAVVDWHQSGWLPEYWEFCKARWTADIGDEWQAEYLPKFLEPYECYDYWDYFALKLGV